MDGVSINVCWMNEQVNESGKGLISSSKKIIARHQEWGKHSYLRHIGGYLLQLSLLVTWTLVDDSWIPNPTNSRGEQRGGIPTPVKVNSGTLTGSQALRGISFPFPHQYSQWQQYSGFLTPPSSATAAAASPPSQGGVSRSFTSFSRNIPRVKGWPESFSSCTPWKNEIENSAVNSLLKTKLSFTSDVTKGIESSVIINSFQKAGRQARLYTQTAGCHL